jgi:L-cysteine:1D-myo-inositol 2-amino-2-deoxy-alpha-D-glucopyranoside ligase
MAIRWALMNDHYRADRMWTDQLLINAESQISALRSVLNCDQVAPTSQLIQEIIDLLADDLNTPAIIHSINNWVAQSQNGATGGEANSLTNALDTLLGIKL